MAYVTLSRRKKAIIDDADVSIISKHTWYAARTRPKRYVAQTGGGILMHRLLINAPKGYEVDHINHNSLDNRRDNLRLVTSRQNHWNGRKKPNCKGSIFKGVYPHGNKFKSFISVDGKRKNLGLFAHEIDAAIAYDAAAMNYFGEYACTNESLGLL